MLYRALATRPASASGDEVDAMFIIGSEIRRDDAKHHLLLRLHAAL